MKQINKILLSIVILFTSSIVLSGCKSKTTTTAPTPTPAPTMVELSAEETPYVSLTPDTDGHNLKLEISNIPDFVTDMEYELLYTVSDNGLEIEKGVGDSIKIDSTSIEREILLGTASCTNGCKYKYDEGVTGGTVNLTLYGDNGSAAAVTANFALTTTADIKKAGAIALPTENYELPISGSITGNDYYVIVKNSQAYSVFSSGSAKNSLIGDHPIEN